MEVDVHEAVQSADQYRLKQVDEELFQVEHRIRSAMDAGVSAGDFPKYEALRDAVEAARGAVARIVEKGDQS